MRKQVNQMRLRKAGAGKSSCTSGVELFPRSFTPLFFYVVPLAGLLISALGIVFLFIPVSRSGGGSSGSSAKSGDGAKTAGA
jgi:hypothetical protein